MSKNDNKNSISDAKNDYTKFIRELAKIATETELTEIEFEKEDIKIKISREKEVIHHSVASSAPVSSAPMAVAAAAPVAAEVSESPVDYKNHPGAITSPMVGVVYLRATPEADAYVKVGSKVKAGDTLVLIEAMKVFTPITASKDGTVKEVLVSDSETVEFGQTLVVID